MSIEGTENARRSFRLLPGFKRGASGTQVVGKQDQGTQGVRKQLPKVPGFNQSSTGTQVVGQQRAPSGKGAFGTLSLSFNRIRRDQKTVRVDHLQVPESMKVAKIDAATQLCRGK